MRARNQHHARADRYEVQHGAELEPGGDRTKDTREQRSREGLHENIAAYYREPPAETGAGPRAEDQFAPPWKHGNSKTQRLSKLLHGHHRRFRGLAVREQKPGADQYEIEVSCQGHRPHRLGGGKRAAPGQRRMTLIGAGVSHRFACFTRSAMAPSYPGE